MEELLEAGHPPDIWIQDLTRGSFSRLTRGPASNFNPIWAPMASTFYIRPVTPVRVRVLRHHQSEHARHDVAEF
ncbi:MAG: hypothetical protein DMG76_18750 [Acidobacteria bacterium]|nr:MAG: hypothetical protein DMG76_18750 [Acidobacteriota bacterium]